jgi:NAD+ synthase
MRDESARALGIRLENALDRGCRHGVRTGSCAGLQRSCEGRDEENIQARARGVLLMAMSNKFSDLLVTTGNKSEMSVGYATLYGDMCGGYSVLKDIYKTDVYALVSMAQRACARGALGPRGRVIPESSLTKAPTAELRPNQDRSGFAAAV